jgi:hypothetical protein
MIQGHYHSLPLRHASTPNENLKSEIGSNLKLLVLELAFQLLGLGDFAYSFVEIVLVDGIAVVFDCEEATIKNLVHECSQNLSRECGLQ